MNRSGHGRSRGVAFLAVGMWVSGLGAGAARADAYGPLTEAEQTEVDRGQIVVQVERGDAAVKRFRAIGLVAAPAERVFAVFTDFEHYGDIFKLKEARVVGRHDRTRLVRAAMDLPWPFGDKWVLNETVLSPASLSFVFHRVEGSITEYEGTVQVIALNPRLSRVEYAAKANPNILFLPTWLLNRFQAVLLPSSISRIREYVATHP